MSLSAIMKVLRGDIHHTSGVGCGRGRVLIDGCLTWTPPGSSKHRLPTHSALQYFPQQKVIHRFATPARLKSRKGFFYFYSGNP